MKTVLAAISVMVLMTVAFAGAPQHAVRAGNGAPSGPHYNLNIIGVPKDKSADMTGDNGHRIFVDLGSKSGAAVTTRIMLSQSFDGTFEVLDANGTDGEASFKLPAPGTYTVWARALGKPGGSATMTTCATDPLDPTAVICSLENEVFVRGTGQEPVQERHRRADDHRTGAGQRRRACVRVDTSQSVRPLPDGISVAVRQQWLEALAGPLLLLVVPCVQAGRIPRLHICPAT